MLVHFLLLVHGYFSEHCSITKTLLYINYDKFYRTINIIVVRMMPGRPRKYDGPVKRFEAWIPYDLYMEMSEFKEKAGLSWPDLIIRMWYVFKAKEKI